MLSKHSRRTRLGVVVALMAGITLISAGASAFNSVMLELQALNLSAFSTSVGGVITGTARFTNPIPRVDSVSFGSSNQVAAIVSPSSRQIPQMSDHVTFQVRGRAAGCADIRAWHRGVSRTSYIVVHPTAGSTSLSLSVPDRILPWGGAPATGSVTAAISALTPRSVSLTSSNTSVVTVPASSPLLRGSASFAITIVGAGCATISATVGDQTVIKTVRSMYIGS